MIIYKTDYAFYIFYILLIIGSLVYLVFISIDYVNFVNSKTLEKDNITVNDKITSTRASAFFNFDTDNLTSNSIQTKLLFSINDAILSVDGSIKTNTYNVDNSEINYLETNNANNPDNIQKIINTDNYYYNEYDFIYGYICFSYYDYNSTIYYKNFSNPFFSLYLNKNIPATSINKYTYEKFLDNENIVKNFKFYNDIFLQNDYTAQDFCYSKCYQSCSVSYEGNDKKYPYLEMNNIVGGFIKNIKVFNTMFYNSKNLVGKTGVFPLSNYMENVKKLYGMNILNLEGLNRKDPNLYGQLATYNSVNFRIEFDDDLIQSDIETSLTYYDYITPKTMFYDDYYGENIVPTTLCDLVKNAKYTYNNPDQNYILSSNSELSVNCNKTNNKKVNVKYINLMTNSYYVMPSFIIGFKINLINNDFEKQYNIPSYENYVYNCNTNNIINNY